MNATRATNDIQLFLTAFAIANIVQDIELTTPGIGTLGYGHFGGGVNPFYYQTAPGVLIVEGYYNSPIDDIHTPFGSWKIGLAIAGSSSEWAALNHTIHSNPRFKLRLICPAVESRDGVYGPWYLVTEFDGRSMGPDIPPFPGSEGKVYQRDSEEFNTIVLPRHALLLSLYKSSEYYSYERGRALYADALALAYERKIWQDSTGIYDRARAALATPSACVAILDEFRVRAPGMDWVTISYLESLRDTLCMHKSNQSFVDLFKVLCYSGLYSR